MIPKRTKRITAEWLNEVLHNENYLEDINIEYEEPEEESPIKISMINFIVLRDG